MRYLYRSFFLAAVSAVCVASQASAAVIYTNDFSANTNQFTITGSAYDSGTGNRATLATDTVGGTSSYLGRLGNGGLGVGTATLALTGLTAGTSYTLSFDLYIGGSWDGNYGTPFGPDLFKVSTGATTLVNATFSNMGPLDYGTINNSSTQSYTDTTPLGGDQSANPTLGSVLGTGADVKSLTNNDIYSRFAIYYFGHGSGNPTLTFTATASTASLVFTTVGLEGPIGDGRPNEFFALDNVLVTGPDVTPPPPPPPPPATVVPAPGNLLMLGSLGVFGLVGRAARRFRKS